MVIYKKIVCKTCGSPLTYIPRYEGLPCNQYCCGHCPDAKKSPCAKERKEPNSLFT